MRYWMDTEFIDDGYTIDLISIGIVAEDGRELYMQSPDFDESHASEWLQQHVFPYLIPCPHLPPQLQLLLHRGGQCTFEEPEKGIAGAQADCPWRTREEMKREILSFMDSLAYGTPELWGWCCAYDFVAFCQLFGTMMDMPQGYPHYMRDFQQVLDERGITDDQLPEQAEGLHHALADAKHLKRLWGYIVRNDAWQ